MSSDARNRTPVGARLWRSFITAAYIVGVLVWTVNDAQQQGTMRLTTCVYGRCPTVLLATAHMRPTLANVVLLGIAAALMAWAVPILFQDQHPESERR